MFDDIPTELQVVLHGRSRLGVGDAHLGSDGFDLCIKVLHKQTTRHGYILVLRLVGRGHIHHQHTKILLGGKYG